MTIFVPQTTHCLTIVAKICSDFVTTIVVHMALQGKMIKRNADKVLNVRLTETEMKVIENYCEQESLTKSELVRQWIRQIKRKLQSTDK